jgi:hypothetical protein
MSVIPPFFIVFVLMVSRPLKMISILTGALFLGMEAAP